MAIGINPAEIGRRVEEFARFVGVVNFTLKINFLITASATATAAVFPQAMVAHDFLMAS
jgi:hypothetical protein